MDKIFNRIKKMSTLAKVIGLLLLLLAPLIITYGYFIHILIGIGMYVILTLSLNLVTGYAGQFSIGHAAFYGIGAYVAALLMLEKGISFWPAMVISAFATAVCGFVLGLPALRLQGDYLGIVTLGFGEIVHLIFVNWISVTRGPMGLPGIPAPQIGSYVFSDKVPYYYTILILAAVTIFVMNRLTTSRYGLGLLTVREDEVAACAIGINTTKAKLSAFIVGAFFAGITGAFFAGYISFISPDSFMYVDSITILSMVVLGGMGSIIGSVVGAVVLVVAPEMLRFLVNYRMILYGLMMIIVMIYKPEGFWGISKRAKNTWLRATGGRVDENA
ncbi:branched-chain amino acid ABC transporter permease [Petroclostridium sp. X23]|uniref:branched-chain amino acid ABC transporter permease n=1 Tax=Petroclostridium sp. X23 TaxID=3045146 RepID=UPI0024AD7C72|nr:branched-chain amino acid ABC transporter permease [Petroclostridium sp. X23]WHH61477.1 branched-chain amino acid ABC transporter permease [Petroclostridium sp. X23]